MMDSQPSFAEQVVFESASWSTNGHHEQANDDRMEHRLLTPRS